MRAWRLIALLVVALSPAAASAAATRATLRVTAKMPSEASVGAPIRIKTKVINRGPSVTRGITVAVGVEKLTGAGARPGLILSGPVQARIAKLAVGKSKTVTLKVTVRGTPHGSAYLVPVPTTSVRRSICAPRPMCASRAPAATSRGPTSPCPEQGVAVTQLSLGEGFFGAVPKTWSQNGALTP